MRSKMCVCDCHDKRHMHRETANSDRIFRPQLNILCKCVHINKREKKEEKKIHEKQQTNHINSYIIFISQMYIILR